MTAAWAQKMFCYSLGGGHWGLLETGKLLKISIKANKKERKKCLNRKLPNNYLIMIKGANSQTLKKFNKATEIPDHYR